MSMDDRVIITGFVDSVTDEYKELPGNKEPTTRSTYTDENGNLQKKQDAERKESRRTCGEKLKRKQSQTNILADNMQIYRTDQADDREVFLPRLAGSSRISSPENKSRDEKGKQVRLPEIRIVSNNLSMLALNRSITDLLDPEMEILNKIKHGPRKRKKRRAKILKKCADNISEGDNSSIFKS